METVTDPDKLIALIQARPALYSVELKNHFNKDTVDHLWHEIAQEMNIAASECRLKWHSLRSSYARYLRETKNLPSGCTAKKRKKWYLADAMSFLNDYVKTRREEKINCDISWIKEADDVEEQETTEDITPFDSESQSSSISCSFEPSSKTKNTHPRGEVLVAPTITSVQTISESGQRESYLPLMCFFKGVLPDIEMLAPKRQRIFKAELVKLVNRLADEEELENSPVKTEVFNDSSA